MVDVKRLADIPELAGFEQKLLTGGETLDSYAAKLSDFTGRFPAIDRQVRSARMQNDIATLEKNVALLCDMLAGIHADKVAEPARASTAQIKSMDTGSLELFVEDFLSEITALSIDIQMAIEGGGGNAAAVEQRTSGNEVPVILAVDDNSFFLNTLKSTLQNSPYKLTCVNSGSVALRFIEKHTPDLYILDIDMPEMDGYALAEQINKSGKKAPIIFMTGNASKEYVLKAKAVGAADFIVKPINRQKTLTKIATYLSGGTL